MKQLRGNIILIVLFVLTTAAAMGMLMLQYTSSMFDSTIMTYEYNKAYYLARGGVELGLADVTSNQIGYEDNYLLTGSDRGCSDNKCSLSGAIIARHTIIGDTPSTIETIEQCSEDFQFILSGNDSIAFPLFYDDGSDFVSSELSNSTISLDGETEGLIINATINMTPIISINDTASIISISESINNINEFRLINIKDTLQPSNSPTGREGEYLVITNTKQTPASFCIQLENGKELA
jgi:hypothetical protein